LLQSRPAVAVENATMENKQPIEIVLSFLEKINAHDVEGICSLMTSDHIFIDGLGNRFSGIENLRKGWASYFHWFPDYAISHEDVLGSGLIVLLTGSARGTYAVGGNLANGKSLGGSSRVESRCQKWPNRRVACLRRQPTCPKNYGAD
jgi:ketosteroid isomerase-like protein